MQRKIHGTNTVKDHSVGVENVLLSSFECEVSTSLGVEVTCLRGVTCVKLEKRFIL